MSTMPNPAQSELYAGLLPVEPLAEPPPVRPTTLENDPPQSRRPLRKRASRAFTRYLIAFFIGVTATLAWQSYGDAARQIIASSYPQLGWLALRAAPFAPTIPESPCIVPPVGERVAAGVAKHVRMRLQFEAGADSRALDHPAKPAIMSRVPRSLTKRRVASCSRATGVAAPVAGC